jgi:hypothetical protein
LDASEYGGATCEPANLLIFGREAAASMAAGTPVRVIRPGGPSVGSPRIRLALVLSSVERMEAAKAGWRAGRMTLPPRDDHKFIP